MKTARALALFAALSLAAPLAHAAEAPARLITVAGAADVGARPDLVIVTAGVVTQAETAKAALEANSQQTAEVIAAIRKAGVEDKDIETTTFSLQPVFVYPQSSDGTTQPPRITGYSVTNSVTVRLREVSRLGTVLDAVVAAGANTIGGIEFAVSNRSEAIDAARAAAIADARRKAELFAKAAGAQVGKVMAIAEATAGPAPIMKAEARAFSAGVPIEPGEQRLAAEVSVTFELVD